MTTFADLTAQLKSSLRSYTGLHEQVTYLTSPCTASDLTLTMKNGDVVSIGVSEIEDEQVYVEAVTDGTVIVPPFGRGYGGSTAAAHAENTMVTFDPAFPSADVKRAINQAVQGTYPVLFQVKSTTLTFGGAVASYELPADCDKVLRVTFDSQAATGYWPTTQRFEFDPHSEEHASGKALIFHEPPLSGATVKVVYQATFSELSATTDTLTSIGFPESAADLIVYGAASQLVRFLDSARLQVGSVENVSRSQLVASGDAHKIANQLYAMYQQRLQEERRKLLDLNPPQMHFTR